MAFRASEPCDPHPPTHLPPPPRIQQGGPGHTFKSEFFVRFLPAETDGFPLVGRFIVARPVPQNCGSQNMHKKYTTHRHQQKRERRRRKTTKTNVDQAPTDLPLYEVGSMQGKDEGGGKSTMRREFVSAREFRSDAHDSEPTQPVVADVSAWSDPSVGSRACPTAVHAALPPQQTAAAAAAESRSRRPSLCLLARGSVLPQFVIHLSQPVCRGDVVRLGQGREVEHRRLEVLDRAALAHDHLRTSQTKSCVRGWARRWGGRGERARWVLISAVSYGMYKTSCLHGDPLETRTSARDREGRDTLGGEEGRDNPTAWHTHKPLKEPWPERSLLYFFLLGPQRLTSLHRLADKSAFCLCFVKREQADAHANRRALACPMWIISVAPSPMQWTPNSLRVSVWKMSLRKPSAPPSICPLASSW